MATRTISTKLAIEGEAEYKAKIKNINAELALHKSELEKVQAQHKNSANTLKALTDKHSALEGQMDALNQKHEEQAEMLERARKAQREFADQAEELRGKLKELGESSASTAEEEEKLREELARAEESMQMAANSAMSYQKEINKTERDQAKLGEELSETERYLDEAKNSTDECAKSIDQYGKKVEDAGESTDSLADKLRTGLTEGAKIAAGAFMTVGTAAVAGMKLLDEIAQSTEEFRTAQGRVNTAFEAAGYSADTAKDAYQTLFSVLGDVDNAAESAQLLAQLARSEEDVAKWGEISAGVVGTFGDALPINSLIEASNETAKVGEVTGALADALNWVGISEDDFNEKLASCADESERTALITGTLSDAYQNACDIFKENNATIMEANRAQAELDDTMARLGGTVADIKTKLMAEFAPAVTEVVDAFVSLAEGVPGAEAAFAAAVDSLIGLAAEKLPEMMEFGSQLIFNLLNGLTEAAPQLAEGGTVLITSLLEGLMEIAPKLAEAGTQLIAGLVEGISEAAPELIPSAAQTVTQLVQALVDNAPLLSDAALGLITGLADGILEAVPVLLEALPGLVESLVAGLLEAVPQITETGVTLLSALVENLPEIIDAVVAVLPEIIDSVVTTLLDHLPDLVGAGVDLLTALVEDIPEIIQTITRALPEIVAAVVNALVKQIPDIVDTGVKLLTALIDDLPHIISEIVQAIPRIVDGMVDTLMDGISKFEDVGANLVRGLWSGIQSLAGWLWSKVSDWIVSIWDGITDFFGIASPSKQMAWVGEMLVEGLAGAVSKHGEEAVEAVGDMASDMMSKVKAETAEVSNALEGAAGDTIRLAIQDAESSFAEQKALVSSMEADFRAKMSKTAQRMGDLRHVIEDTEVEIPGLSAAYAQAAQEALYNMEHYLPSTVVVPDPTAALGSQIASIVSAGPSREENSNPIQIYVDKLEVRDDRDPERIARELYYLAERESRSRGGGSL